MAGVSMGTGLSSGIDYTSMISQLMQIEARPQTLLRIQLAGVQTDAGAYRDVNSSFAALVSAAKAVQDPATWSAAKATTSDTSVTATSKPGAAAGSLTFTVDQLAAAHGVMSQQTWTSTTAAPVPAPASTTLTVTQGTKSTPLDTKSGSLADTIAAINGAPGLGLKAQAVRTGTAPDQYRLQVTSTATGKAAEFGLSYGGSNEFTVVSKAADAQLTIGSDPFDFQLTSPTNTFEGVLEGTSLTVSKKTSGPVTLDVGANTAAAVTAVQSLVTAANGVLTKIKEATDSSPGSIAALKGNYALTSLASQVLTAVSSAVGGDGSAVGKGSSPAVAGLQLTDGGKLKFDSAVFTKKLTEDPTLVQGLFAGKLDAGSDNVPGTVDDTVATDGLGARLQRLAQMANDSVNGSLTLLANGQDTRAKDLTKQISDWDTRLASRQASLTKQFNAMESALGALQNQASWLSSQLNSLPSWSSNS